MRRSLLGAAALAAGAVGGTVLGYLAERTVVDPAAELLPDSGDGAVERRDVRSADGTRLTMLSSGPPDGHDILLVPGLSLTHEIWTDQRTGLHDRYRVTALDLRGHGDSDDAVSGDYSTAALGADVVAALEALAGGTGASVAAGGTARQAGDAPAAGGREVRGDRRCVVVGHSMGGMAVLAALQGRPDLMERQVAGVCLVNTAAAAIISGLRGGSIAAGIAFVRERARSTPVGRVLYGGLDDAGLPRGNDLATLVTRTLGVGPRAPAQAVVKLRRLVLDSRPHVAGEMWRTAGTVDLLAAAAAVTVPVLVVAGGHDRVLPVHHSRRLAETVADAELVELAGVGHVAMMERPDEITALLERFARRVLTATNGYGRPRRRALS